MQKRISDYGIKIGNMQKGKYNKITDVSGVKVGHSTVKNNLHNTGVTVVMPTENNIFLNKFVAASYVSNGFGKTIGTVQIDELGTLETPIALTNTLNVGKVADSIVEYMIDICKKDNYKLESVNPVVGECNDHVLNDIQNRIIGYDNVIEAIDSAATVDFEEGSVGAGTGTICYGLKGGIGSASRVFKLDDKEYTLGILVQSNYGKTDDLILNGKPVGDKIAGEFPKSGCDKGSIIVVMACDVPLTARQLKRVIKRCAVGIARLGSYIGHGSGEVFIGFSTANVIPHNAEIGIQTLSCLNENKIDILFRAAGEATEEAILNSMICAEKTTGYSGKVVHSLKDYIDDIM